MKSISKAVLLSVFTLTCAAAYAQNNGPFYYKEKRDVTKEFAQAEQKLGPEGMAEAKRKAEAKAIPVIDENGNVAFKDLQVKYDNLKKKSKKQEERIITLNKMLNIYKEQSSRHSEFHPGGYQRTFMVDQDIAAVCEVLLKSNAAVNGEWHFSPASYLNSIPMPEITPEMFCTNKGILAEAGGFSEIIIYTYRFGDNPSQAHQKVIFSYQSGHEFVVRMINSSLDYTLASEIKYNYTLPKLIKPGLLSNLIVDHTNYKIMFEADVAAGLVFN
ncbi:hypothetical protein Dip510_000006 [Elusimicrobium posterum]|uniref:hypothetical protein n=1 Tax=Elusimicrobium posterum TaxID=3116653 RepID=UPI003C70E598